MSNKNKVGRPRKYTEETITVAFRIPKSLKEKLNNVVNKLKEDYKIKK